MHSLVWLYEGTWQSNWVEVIEERIPPSHNEVKPSGGWMPEVIREGKRLLLMQHRSRKWLQSFLSKSTGWTTCWVISYNVMPQSLSWKKNGLWEVVMFLLFGNLYGIFVHQKYIVLWLRLLVAIYVSCQIKSFCLFFLSENVWYFHVCLLGMHRML